MKTNKGFTLIELLVVIAIIGVLASVVLASLGSARTKGNDSKVKAQLANIRPAAGIYLNENGNFAPVNATADVCTVGVFADVASGMAALIDPANYPAGTTVDCRHNANVTTAADAWAVSANLGTAGEFWCVDSTGASVQTTAAQTAGDVTCA